jgi:hypothetical protein
MAEPVPPRARVVVVANKNWEADPLVAVLLSDRTRPASLTDFESPGYPRLDPKNKGPRIRFKCGVASVEVWCVQDLMDPKVSGSNSAEKGRVLPAVFKGDPVSAVIAFGTAGYPDSANLNGCVVIGSRVMLHDPQTKETDRYSSTLPDQVSKTALPVSFFRGIDADVRFPAEGRFLRTPLLAARPPVILAGHNWIALSEVNVTNYDDYVWTDPETIAKFHALDPKAVSGRVASVETTHGIIREASDPAPFIFVSAITDRIPLFDLQVTPRTYSQNFVAAHNAGVALAWLIPEVVKQLVGAA